MRNHSPDCICRACVQGYIERLEEAGDGEYAIHSDQVARLAMVAAALKRIGDEKDINQAVAIAAEALAAMDELGL